jgi:hypothetical protein
MKEFEAEQEDVMVLFERVTEAQRIAQMVKGCRVSMRNLFFFI